LLEGSPFFETSQIGKKGRRSQPNLVYEHEEITVDEMLEHIPTVNVSQNRLSSSTRIVNLDVLCHPCHQMVFKNTLDELVKEVGRQKLMYIGIGKS